MVPVSNGKTGRQWMKPGTMRHIDGVRRKRKKSIENAQRRPFDYSVIPAKAGIQKCVGELQLQAVKPIFTSVPTFPHQMGRGFAKVFHGRRGFNAVLLWCFGSAKLRKNAESKMELG